MPHFIDQFIDRRIFLDVCVGGGDVGLGLVVIVIADKIFDRIIRKELAELVVELSGEGLVGRQNQAGAIDPGDDIGHGEGLAGPGDTQQHLALLTFTDALGNGVNSLGLVTAG